MLLLNFGHPITDSQLQKINVIVGKPIEKTHMIATQFDHSQPFAEQITKLVQSVPLTETDWQITPYLVNPPSLAPIAAALIAELHGKCGYFPTLIRLRPIPNVVPPQFEVAELLNLQAIRDSARHGR